MYKKIDTCTSNYTLNPFKNLSTINNNSRRRDAPRCSHSAHSAVFESRLQMHPTRSEQIARD